MVPGFRLNRFLEVENCLKNPLNDNSEYQVCAQVWQKLERARIPRRQPRPAQVIPETGATIPNRKSRRINKNTMISDGRFNKVSIKIDDDSSFSTLCFVDDDDLDGGSCYDGDDESDRSASNGEHTNTTRRMRRSRRRRRRTKSEKLVSDVNEVLSEKGYRLSYSKLVIRERHRRVHDLSSVVIAACVDKLEFHSDGAKYLMNNFELAEDILTILEAIKHTIQQRIRINLNNLENEVVPPPDNLSTSLQVANNDVINVDDVVSKPESLDGAIALLSRCTRDSYEELRKKFIETFDIPVQKLPSYHMMTKHRPELESFAVTSTNMNILSDVSTNIDSTSEPDDQLLPIKSASDFVSIVNVDFEDAMKIVDSKKDSRITILVFILLLKGG